MSAIELSTEQRRYLTWYCRAVWFGVVMNLWFCLTAWFAPERILRLMGLEQTTRNVWLRNVGMLLVNVSLFNAVAALDPTRYPLLSYSVAAARLIASLFFLMVSQLGMRSSTERPKAFVVAREEIDVDELRDFVAGQVAEYKRIDEIEEIDALPRSPTGKLLRRLLVASGELQLRH